MAVGFTPATVALVPLASPKRVYDSRAGQPPANVVKGVLPSGGDRDVDVKNNASGVPATARAVVGNVTVTNTSNGGFVDIRPAGTAWAGTSTVNFSGTGQTVANAFTATLGPNATSPCVAAARRPPRPTSSSTSSATTSDRWEAGGSHGRSARGRSVDGCWRRRRVSDARRRCSQRLHQTSRHGSRRRVGSRAAGADQSGSARSPSSSTCSSRSLSTRTSGSTKPQRRVGVVGDVGDLACDPFGERFVGDVGVGEREADGAVRGVAERPHLVAGHRVGTDHLLVHALGRILFVTHNDRCTPNWAGDAPQNGKGWTHRRLTEVTMEAKAEQRPKPSRERWHR